MERLTKQVRGSEHYVPRECADCDCVADCGDCEYDVACIDRLAAYEDSGLSPDRVMEMSKAQEEGRLFVSPCRIGESVWIIDNGGIREFEVVSARSQHGLSLIQAECKEQSDDCACGDGRCCGVRFTAENMRERDIYFTRAEAEAALAERQGGG